jgi:hypothetical protein
MCGRLTLYPSGDEIAQLCWLAEALGVPPERLAEGVDDPAEDEPEAHPGEPAAGAEGKAVAVGTQGRSLTTRCRFLQPTTTANRGSEGHLEGAGNAKTPRNSGFSTYRIL